MSADFKDTELYAQCVKHQDECGYCEINHLCQAGELLRSQKDAWHREVNAQRDEMGTATEEAHILASLGFIDTPGGAEWRRLIAEGQLSVLKINEAIVKAQTKCQALTDDQIQALWK